MDVKDRLKLYLKEIGCTVSDFEKSISVANGYVNSISKSIGIDKLHTILEKYPNLSMEWLLIGRGYMIKNDGTDASGEKPDNTYVSKLEASIIKLQAERDMYKELFNGERTRYERLMRENTIHEGQSEENVRLKEELKNKDEQIRKLQSAIEGNAPASGTHTVRPLSPEDLHQESVATSAGI